MRVEHHEPSEGRSGAQYLLTFDVGWVLVRRGADGRLDATHVTDRDELRARLSDASEDEPWWRLLGAPLARCDASEDARRIRLQFAIDGARPRTLRLATGPAGVQALIEAGD